MESSESQDRRDINWPDHIDCNIHNLGDGMTLNDFAKQICEMEKGKAEVNIAQVKEILRCINDIFGGEFYNIIRRM